MKSLAVLASVAMVAVLALAAVPVTASAGPADYYFFIGTWTGEYSSSGVTMSWEITFDIGGTYDSKVTVSYSLYGYSSSDTTEESGRWMIEGGQLYTVSDELDDWPDEGVDYSFSSLYTKLTLSYEILYTQMDVEFEKKGSVCGVCCPFCFSVVVPAAVLGIGLVVYRRHKGIN